MVETTATGARIAGLYPIADLPAPAGISDLDYASALLGARPGGSGPCMLQLRAKSATHVERCQILQQLALRTARAGVLLIVNDDIAAALAIAGVDGLHVGQEDLRSDSLGQRTEELREIRQRAADLGRELLIGLSTHDLEQIRRANELPIDYLGFGPVFPTRSKVGADPSVGLDKLHRACELSERPLVAIGGLDDQSAIAARRTGADAVALISALRRPSIAQIRARVLALSDLLLATDHGSASSHGTS